MILDRSLSVRISFTIVLLVFQLSSLYLVMDIRASSTYAHSSLNTARDDSQIAPIQISPEILYTDSLPPNSSRYYVLKAPKKSILAVYVKANVTRSKLQLKIQAPGDRLAFAFPPLPKHITGTFHYVDQENNVFIEFRNLQKHHAVNYDFYVTISEPVKANASRRVPLSGCPSFFHVNLRRGDEISIYCVDDVSSASTLDVKAYILYHSRTPLEEYFILEEIAKGKEGHLTFTADLTDRYFIMVKPGENISTFWLRSRARSPIWNGKWFWLALMMISTAGLSCWFLIKLIGNLEKLDKYAFIGSYFSFNALVWSDLLLAAYYMGVSDVLPMFGVSLTFCGLSLISQIYTAVLRRKSSIVVCPYCFKRWNVEHVSFCCGRKLQRISYLWYLAPIAIGFYSMGAYAFLVLQALQFGLELYHLLQYAMYVGLGGCMLGGGVAWLINRKKYKRKAMKFFVVGLLSAAIFPLLSAYLIAFMGIFLPVVEYEIYPEQGFVRRLTRVEALPPLPEGFLWGFTILTIGLCYLLIKQVRMVLLSVKRNVPKSNQDLRKLRVELPSEQP